jgi:O-methyltransferase
MLKLAVRSLLRRTGLYGIEQRLKRRLGLTKDWMSHPPYGPEVRRLVMSEHDVVRFSSVALALRRIEVEQVPGDLAEVGVYRGEMSRCIAAAAPGRRLHLFDTFSGFSTRDADTPDLAADRRFRETSVEVVRRALGPHAGNAVFHVGFFPDTASDLVEERFAFVMLDVDRHRPTLAGLEVFYPRLSRGGFVFIHDYNAPESDWGVSRAADEFLEGKPELLIELPDARGSAVFRKV